jgi:hypothetical protein
MPSYDLAQQIDTASGQPAEAMADGISARAHPLPDQIAADRYLAAKNGRAQRYRGLIFSKLIPAAASPDQQATQVGGLSTSFDFLG